MSSLKYFMCRTRDKLARVELCHSIPFEAFWLVFPAGDVVVALAVGDVTDPFDICHYFLLKFIWNKNGWDNFKRDTKAESKRNYRPSFCVFRGKWHVFKVNRSGTNSFSAKSVGTTASFILERAFSTLAGSWILEWS